MAVFTGGGGLGRRNGSSASSTQNRLLILAPCLLSAIGVLLVLYQVAWMYWLPGAFVKDTETISVLNANADGTLTVSKKTVTRRHPDQLYTLDDLSGEKVPNTPTKAILDGYFTLIDLQIPSGMDLMPTLHEDGMTEKMYSSVIATFCHISWELQNDVDSTTALSTFADLQKASVLCPGTKVEVDFWDIVHQVRQLDAQREAPSAKKDALHVVAAPTAVLFHESKCGSTLMTNTLAAFAAPHHTRVYVEAPPPLTALQACELHASLTPRRCAKESHRALIQDVFYMMGRIQGATLPQHVFHKIHSTGVQSMDAFVQAMPTTPWVFLYRHSIEVMMSHFSHYSPGGDKGGRHTPECLRQYGQPTWQQPPLLVSWVEQLGQQLSQLTPEEYCAAHLAGLALSAIQEHERTQQLALDIHTHAIPILHAQQPNATDNDHHALAAPPHWFVNYNELPYMIWERFLPSLLVHPVGRADMDRMRKAASMKVHSRQKKKSDTAPEHWTEDGTMKQGTAPQSIVDAVTLFLDPIYEQLEAIRQSSIQQHPKKE